MADVDLLVAGAPVIAFGLPTEGMRKQIAADARNAPTPPDVIHLNRHVDLIDVDEAVAQRARHGPG